MIPICAYRYWSGLCGPSKIDKVKQLIIVIITDRGLIQETETERNLKERIKEIIDERDLLM